MIELDWTSIFYRREAENAMEIHELNRCIAELRRKPLMMVCRTPKGTSKVMNLEECIRSGSSYVHIVADDLDELLAAELGEGTT